MELTREQIEKMTAGRELDKLIAQLVLRIPIRLGIPEKAGEYDTWFERREDRPWEYLRYYSTSHDDAWDLVDVLLARGLFLEITVYKGRVTVEVVKERPDSQVFLESQRVLMTDADTAPLAICQAALMLELHER